MNRLAFLCCAALMIPGCDWPLESGQSGPSGQSDYRTSLAGIGVVTAPDAVDVGSQFEVVMLSYGPNGCWSAGPSVVRQVDPLSATIIPFDREYIGEENVCTQNAPTLRHSVYLMASVKGTFEVNVRRAGGSTIQRTVVVR